MSTEPTKQEIEIEQASSIEFVFENYSVFHENGVWWAEFFGNEDEDVLIIEYPEKDIYFNDDPALLEIGIDQETFERMRDVV